MAGARRSLELVASYVGDAAQCSFSGIGYVTELNGGQAVSLPIFVSTIYIQLSDLKSHLLVFIFSNKDS